MMLSDSGAPFGRGSISASLYVHGLPGHEAAAFLVRQAQIAEDAGFDGVTLSEHHGGLFEYMPSPLLASARILGATRRIWAGPCPLLLSLRTPSLVAEEVAWLASMFPGRLGCGFGPGTPTTPADFELVNVPVEERRKRFSENLGVVVPALSGNATGPLGNDPAIRACRAHPVSCLSTVGGPIGARRAARLGMGLVPSSTASFEVVRGYVAAYHDAGGSGTIMINRRAWLGPPDNRRLDSLNRHSATRPGAVAGEKRFSTDFISSEDPADVAKGLIEVLQKTGATAINIKFFFPDVTTEEMARQLRDFGESVIPNFKRLVQAGSSKARQP